MKRDMGKRYKVENFMGNIKIIHKYRITLDREAIRLRHSSHTPVAAVYYIVSDQATKLPVCLSVLMGSP